MCSLVKSAISGPLLRWFAPTAIRPELEPSPDNLLEMMPLLVQSMSLLIHDGAES